MRAAPSPAEPTDEMKTTPAAVAARERAQMHWILDTSDPSLMNFNPPLAASASLFFDTAHISR